MGTQEEAGKEEGCGGRPFSATLRESISWESVRARNVNTPLPRPSPTILPLRPVISATSLGPPSLSTAKCHAHQFQLINSSQSDVQAADIAVQLRLPLLLSVDSLAVLACCSGIRSCLITVSFSQFSQELLGRRGFPTEQEESDSNMHEPPRLDVNVLGLCIV